MSSQLHERRKSHHHADVVDDSAGIQHHIITSPAKFRKLVTGRSSVYSREICIAIVSIVGFLLVALCFSDFLILHQHRYKMALRGLDKFSDKPKFVTVVLPSPEASWNGAPRYKRLNAIEETWGTYARAIFVVNNITDEIRPETDEQKNIQLNGIISQWTHPKDPFAFPQILLLPHSKKPTSLSEALSPKQNEDTTSTGHHINRIESLRYIIDTIYKKVNPDFAFFVNDNTYVIPEHLCDYLSSKDPAEDGYYGHALKYVDETKSAITEDSTSSKLEVFNHGGAGYVLSRSTMSKLVEKWAANETSCLSSSSTKHQHQQQSENDDDEVESSDVVDPAALAISRCLYSLNIYATDTRKYGRYHRFHIYPLFRMVTGDDAGDEATAKLFDVMHRGVDDYFIQNYRQQQSKNDNSWFFRLNRKNDIKVRTPYDVIIYGDDCCSFNSISFSNVDYNEAKALFELRQLLLQHPHASEHELKVFIMHEWSKFIRQGKITNGQQHAAEVMLDNTNDENWVTIISTIRRISRRRTTTRPDGTELRRGDC